MDAKSEIGVEHLLERCHRIETLMAATYWFLALLHEGKPEVAAIWRKTAGEEENHARQFEYALKFSNLVTSPAVAAENVDRLLEDVLSFDTAVRASRPVPADALRRSIALERRLADYHMDTIGVFHDPQMRKLFEAMMAADRGHVEALIAVLDGLATGR